jgi:hypothetical protein
MAQTGFTPIQIYSSNTAAAAPAAGNLANTTLGSELAINITDGKLFYKDNANAVQVIAWKVTPTSAGGTGLTSYAAGDLVYYASGTTFTKLAIGASGQYLSSSGSAPQWTAPAALTKTDDTNVTLTLGGSASTALLNAASLTLGWSGQLATTRGGTGLSSFTANGILYASSTSAIATSSNLTFDGSNFATTGTVSATKFFPTGGGPTGNGMYLPGSNEVAISTNGVERMRYLSEGTILAGTTDTGFFAGSTLGVGIYAASGFIAASRSGALSGLFNRYTSDGEVVQFRRSGSIVGSVNVTTLATTYTSISDYRLKNNPQPLINSGAFIDSLQPKTWQWSIDGSTGVGFIAHEVQAVSPTTVTGTRDAQDKNGNPQYQSMEYGSAEFIANMIAELQSLRLRVAALESK